MFYEDVPYTEKQLETDPCKRRVIWDIATGLQKVDDLSTSEYMDELIEGHIKGEYTTDSVLDKLNAYYVNNKGRGLYGDRVGEADLVSARLYEYIDAGGFTLNPLALKDMHGFLFQDVLPSEYVGKWRTENIEKAEKVLGGRSVEYGTVRQIGALLEYDFAQEKGFRYSIPFDTGQIEHLSEFVSSIWQVHPFREGNTRTVALFTIIYLKSMGIEVTNDIFRDHSKYFRDALVRANYASIPEGIHADPKYLYRFFENALGVAEHDLREDDLRCAELINPETPE